MKYCNLFIDQSNDFYWVVDINLNLVYANNTYLKLIKEMIGFEKKLNTPIFEEGLDKDYIKKWKTYYLRSLSGEKFEIEEHFFNFIVEEMQFARTTFLPIEDENGEVSAVACHSSDITSLVKQKDHASYLMDASLDVFCSINEEGEFVFVSEASREHWGYAPKELIGTPFRNLIIQEDKEKTDVAAVNIMAGIEYKSFSNRYRKKNGDISYNLWSARWDSDEKLMFCVARDSKERMEQDAENELLSKISLSFNKEEELTSAANRLCENLYDFGKFDLIELWCPNMERNQIELIGHSNHNKDFYKIESTVNSFEKNMGLPGKVWQNGNQLLWDEKQINKDFIRKKGASYLNLQALLGVPLTCKDELVGVLLIGTRKKLNYLDIYSPILSRLERFIGSEINRKKLENNLKNIFDTIPEILCIMDFEGRFLKINNAGCDLLRYNSNEILFNGIDEFSIEEDKGKFKQKINRLKNDSSAFTFENRLLSNDGKVIWFSWNCIPSIKEQLIYASAKNITTEVKYRELNAQAGSLAKIGSWEVDLENNTVYWSKIVHEIHETDPDAFFPDLEKSINFYREDFRSLVKSSIQGIIETGEKFDFESVIITKNLNEKWVRSIGSLEVVNGKAKRLFGSFQDIHDRKMYEEALRESEDKFRSIFEIASLGIAQVYPANGQILLVNSYYEDITGYSTEEMLQMKFSELTHPDDRKRDWDLFCKAARGEIEYRNEKRYVRKDGSIVWVRIHLSFIRDENGTPLKTVAICENISDRKEIEFQLKNLSDNLPGAVLQYLLRPDRQDQILYISEGSYQVCGLSPEECQRSTEKIWNQIEAGGYKKEVENSIMESAQNLTPWFAQWKTISPDKKVKWCEGRGLPQKLPDGSVLWNSLIIDITEKKDFEVKYQQTLTEKVTILESISDAFYAVDTNWNFTYFNGKAENLLKKSADEVLGENIWEVFSPAQGTILEKAYRKVASTGQSENFEYLYPGDGCWYELNVYPSSSGLACYFKNIDERRKAVQELEEAYKEKNEILESIGDGFFTVDNQWTVTYWNKEAEAILGRSRKDVLGKNLWEEFPDTINSRFYKHFQNNIVVDETKNFEEYYSSLNMWIELTVYSTEKGLSIYFKDITLRKKADIRLLAANERFEIITRATNDAIWDYDIIEDTLFWGDGFKTLFGFEVDKITPTIDFWMSHIHLDDLKRVEKSVAESIKNKDVKIWSKDYRYQKADGTFAFVRDKGIIIRDKTGKAIRILGAMSDFTQLKKQEIELLEVNKSLENYTKELERSNEDLEQFAYISSHDLQEPLRMISSFMDQLARKYSDRLDDKALQYIHYATDGAKRMKQIILDLLLYSRANKPSEELEEVNLNEVIKEYIQLRARLIAENDVTINSDKLPVFQTHKAPVVQVFNNLLDNAIRYGRENVPPQIEIHVKEKKSFWEFSISDNGIGIDEEFYNKIFIIFQRLHNRKENDGTGIGLSIAKRCVQFLGGEIWLESTKGKGSTFYFTIAKK